MAKRLSRIQRNATINIGEEGRPSDWSPVCGESRMYGSTGGCWKSVPLRRNNSLAVYVTICMKNSITTIVNELEIGKC